MLYLVESAEGSSVVYSPEERRYLLYYSTIADTSTDWERKLYYADGMDGISFEPRGCINGIEKTGSLLATRDSHTRNEAERFKTVVLQIDPGNPGGGNGFVAVSEDGINWATPSVYRMCEQASDTSNNAFYNQILGKYQVICRDAHIDRRITSILSDDLRTWSDPLLILAPNPLDVPLTQYYGMTVAILFALEGNLLPNHAAQPEARLGNPWPATHLT